MPLKIIFDEFNDTEDGLRFYAATEPMDVNALPAPVATTGPSSSLTPEPDRGPDAVSYTIDPWDETQPSYVRVAAFLGDTEVVSDEWHFTGGGGGGEFPPGTEIGDLVVGGVYAGDIEYPDGRKFRIIFGLQASEASGLRWGPSDTAAGAASTYDGMANQELILARADGESYNAFVYCRDYVDVDGNNDYYLPARNELALEANVRAHPELNTSRSTYRWSSTELSDRPNAWVRRFSDGNTDHYGKTTTTRLVRPVRRVEFQ